MVWYIQAIMGVYEGISNIIEWAIRPAPEVSSTEDRERSSLVGAMSLVFAASIPLALGLLAPLRPEVFRTADSLVLLIGAGLLIAIYFINRLASFLTAYVMLMVVILFVPLLAPFVPGGAGQMLALQVIPVLAYAFLHSPQASLFAMLVTGSFSALMIATMPAGPIRGVYIDSWLLMVVLDVAVLALMAYQRQIENQRRAELEQANHRLMRSELELEARVNLRTEQLRAINLLLAEEVAMRKRSEEDLTRVHERLQGLDRLKKEFIDSVSHELRTPITTLKVYHHLLMERPEQAAAYGPRLQAETARLEQVVAAILSISQLTAELQDATYTESIDLGAMVGEKVEQWAMRMDARGITCTVTGALGLPLRVNGNRVLLDHLLTILMDNILKYTPEGGQVQVEVIAGSPEQPSLMIAMSNTTSSLEQGNLDHLFDRFTRGNAALTSKVAGAGLGLFMAREITGRHRGSLSLEAATLKGEPALRIVIALPAFAYPVKVSA